MIFAHEQIVPGTNERFDPEGITAISRWLREQSDRYHRKGSPGGMPAAYAGREGTSAAMPPASEDFPDPNRWYRSLGSLNHRLMAVIPSGSGLCGKGVLGGERAHGGPKVFPLRMFS